MRFSIQLSIAICLLSYRGVCGQQPRDDGAERIASEVESAIKRGPSSKAGQVTKSLLEKLDVDSLKRIKISRGDSSRLFAAWQLCRTNTREHPPERLFGFIEGKYGIEIPGRWQKGVMQILSEMSDENRRLMQPTLAILEQKFPRTKRQMNACGGKSYYSTQELKVTDVSGGFTVIRGGLSLTIKKPAFDKYLSEFYSPNLVHLFDDAKLAFLSLYDDYGSKFPVFCFDKGTGNLAWVAQIWAAGAEKVPARTGVWGHSLFVTTNERLIAIFGICAGGCYLDILEKKTGTTIARFSTHFWYAKTMD